jgi:hypothetical protein
MIALDELDEEATQSARAVAPHSPFGGAIGIVTAYCEGAPVPHGDTLSQMAACEAELKRG